MDNLTHTLVGVALSRAFFKGRTPYATTAMVVAANAPDLDVLAGWRGIRYIEFHRGIAHSLVALPAWALLIALGLRWMARRKGVAAGWSLPLLLGAAGVASHLLLDLTNAYGIRLLAPFSQHWYAWDLMPIFDPWLWLILGVFLGFPMLLGLIGNEMGAPRNRHRVSAAVALLAMAGWWGFRETQRRAALDLLTTPAAEAQYQGQVPWNWAALPTVASPYVWQGVVDLPRNYALARLDTDAPPGAQVTPERNYIKPPLTPAIARAEQTQAGRIFLGFARFPLAQAEDVEQEGSQLVVTITDLRFAEAGRRPQMALKVVLGPGDAVQSEQFSWGR